jgi:hypothetical protein
MDRHPMTSNIEPIAREITRGIYRDDEMPETQIDRWVDWQCAAAMLEAGVWMKGATGSRGTTGAEARKLTEKAFGLVSDWTHAG